MKPDVIVIGGGIAGTALTYSLARAGVRPLLLERGRIGGAASGATMGMALWINMRTEEELSQAVSSVLQLAQLEQELEANLDYRQLPSLVLAPDETMLSKLQAQAESWQQAGLSARMVELAEIRELEPSLDSDHFVGALYAEQAHLDGTALTRAYADAARRLGAEVREYVSVYGFDVRQERVIAVQTRQGTLSAAQIVLAAGAWTRQLAALAGIDLPIYYIHGQALATAPLSLVLNCMLMVARPDGYTALERRVAAALGTGNDWEQWHNDAEAQDTSIVQLADGRVLLGQITQASPTLNLSLFPAAVERIKYEAAQLVPALADAPIQFTWIAPASFTPDQQAMLGPVPDSSNLYVCAGFKSALLTASIACERLARQILSAADL